MVGCALPLLFLLVLAAGPAFPQLDPGNRWGERQGDEIVYRPQTPWITLHHLDPLVRKYYMGHHDLYPAYRWKAWETTNYALGFYQRYFRPELQGIY